MTHYVDAHPTRFWSPGAKCLSVLAVYQKDRLVSLWPFAQKCGRTAARIEWLGEPVSQYGDALINAGVDAEQHARDVLTQVERSGRADLLTLRKVRADSPVHAALVGLGARRTASDAAPALKLSSDPEQVFASLPARHRKNRRRQRRRLEEIGLVEFDPVMPGKQTADLLALALRWKRAWLRRRNTVSLAFANRRVDRFFADAVRATHAHGFAAPVFVLRLNRTPIAINIPILHHGRMLLHITAYDPAFERVGPGGLLFEESIAWACANGFHTFDLMSPADAYKACWASEATDLCDFSFGVTWRGRIWQRAYFEGLRPVGKRLATGAPRVVAPVARMLNF